MIKGNSLDVFTIVLDNGDHFSLMAKDLTMARIMAQNIAPNETIAAIHNNDNWEDHAE